MRFTFTDLDGAADARGTVVVLDVLRAFTTAAYALARGAVGVRPVATVAEARAWAAREPGCVLAGEHEGHPIAGFDYGNSPVEIAAAPLAGRVLVQRTTAGTQGVVRSRWAARRLAASFVVAGATAAILVRDRPGAVTFVVTGASRGRDGDEDRACGEYVMALAEGHNPDPAPFLARVRASTAGRHFTDGAHPHLDPRDVQAALEVDRFGFAMVLDGEGLLRRRDAGPLWQDAGQL